MTGLYVPLDVDYASDDKLIEAGPLAELLYVRGLAFAKRTMKDGVIKRSQLTAVGIGIPSVTKHAASLVNTGAWTATPDGWIITAWLKRNKSAAQIKADGEQKKAASVLANHTRWHVGEDKEPSASCPHCYPKSDPPTDPKSDPQRESTKQRQREDRGKTEEERRTEDVDDSLAPHAPLAVIHNDRWTATA